MASRTPEISSEEIYMRNNFENNSQNIGNHNVLSRLDSNEDWMVQELAAQEVGENILM